MELKAFHRRNVILRYFLVNDRRVILGTLDKLFRFLFDDSLTSLSSTETGCQRSTMQDRAFHVELQATFRREIKVINYSSSNRNMEEENE